VHVIAAYCSNNGIVGCWSNRFYDEMYCSIGCLDVGALLPSGVRIGRP